MRIYNDKLSVQHRHKHMNKVTAMTFTTFNNELVISFDGFEDQKDIRDFADFVFSKIKMRYWHSDKAPTYH